MKNDATSNIMIFSARLSVILEYLDLRAKDSTVLFRSSGVFGFCVRILQVSLLAFKQESDQETKAGRNLVF